MINSAQAYMGTNNEQISADMDSYPLIRLDQINLLNSDALKKCIFDIFVDCC